MDIIFSFTGVLVYNVMTKHFKDLLLYHLERKVLGIFKFLYMKWKEKEIASLMVYMYSSELAQLWSI